MLEPAQEPEQVLAVALDRGGELLEARRRVQAGALLFRQQRDSLQ